MNDCLNGVGIVLITIKIAHTILWALLGGSILALPILGVYRKFRWTLIITLVILAECAVLLLNGGRCPLTDIASHYTPDRAPNFDIYLPASLALYNKVIFGALFVGGEIAVILLWLRQRRPGPS